MTWDKLIQRSLVPFEGRPGQLETRAGLYLDEAQEDFALHTKCHIKKTNIYITANKVFVELPKDFVELCDNPVFRGEYLTRSTYGGYDYNKEIENNQLNIIGEIINLENEKNNLLVVKLFKDNKEVLIPFVKEIVPFIDIKNKFIIITPPKGLLEL